jgi:hypothetical protein
MVDGVIMGYIISRKTQSLIILICSGGDLSGLGQGLNPGMALTEGNPGMNINQ